MNRHTAAIALAIVLGIYAGGDRPAHAADRLVLRSGERIADRTVVSLDEDGLKLDGPAPGGGDVLTWDQIESGTLLSDKQAEFNRLLSEIGDDLFRVRWRLHVGDTDHLLEPAERLYPRFRERRSRSALLVCTATMRGRIAAGRREAAVEPLLQIIEILRGGAASASDVPGPQPLQVDPQKGWCAELPPIWFDANGAQQQAPEVLATIRTMQQPRPDGVRLYYGSLASLAGDDATADQMLAAEPQDEGLAHLRLAILVWRQALQGKSDENAARLDALRLENKLAADVRPAALYALGLSKTLSPDADQLRDGALDLVEVAATRARTNRELAAAGLYQAAQALDKLKDAAGAKALRQELRIRFAGTSHAAKLK